MIGKFVILGWSEKPLPWVALISTVSRNPVHTDFKDTLAEASEVGLPGVAPGTNPGRFRAKAAAYLKEHEDNIALQRLRRNRQLTADDLESLEQMLIDSGVGTAEDVARATEEAQGLGLFIRSLVGLDRQAAVETFGRYLDGSKFTVDQIRFINLIIDELTASGVMDPARLYESPYVDHAPTGPDLIFPEADVELIVEMLRSVKAHAVPRGAA